MLPVADLPPGTRIRFRMSDKREDEIQVSATSSLAGSSRNASF